MPPAGKMKKFMTDEKYPDIPNWLLDEFPPDRLAAVEYLRHLVDEDMLREIARADYGDSEEKHFAKLEPVWSRGQVGELDSWYPREVLELMRWSEPEDPSWSPGSPGIRGHTIRAFCCAVLLAAPGGEPAKETLIQMVDSAQVLGGDALDSMARFLTHKIDTLGSEQDRPFFALALVAITYLRAHVLPASREGELADWLGNEEAAEREFLSNYAPGYAGDQWLFGLSFNDMRNDRWRALIERIQSRSGDGPLAELLKG